MNLLSLDARWRRFNDPEFRSPIDGRGFSGIYDLGFDAPDAWPHGPRGEAEMLEVEADRLAAELCKLGEDRFIHAILALPVRGSDEVLFLAPWVQVSQDAFYAYIDSLSPEGTAFESAEGILANALPGFAEAMPPCRLAPGEPGERPLIMPTDPDLAEAASDGISFDQLLDLYAEAGDDIRPHLTT